MWESLLECTRSTKYFMLFDYNQGDEKPFMQL